MLIPPSSQNPQNVRSQTCIYHCYIHSPRYIRPLQFSLLEHRRHTNKPPPSYSNTFVRAVTKTLKHHHITPVLKTLHWLKIAERIEYRVVSLTYNTSILPALPILPASVMIQPPCSTRSSSTLTLLRPSVTSSLKFSNCSITIAVPPLW